MKAKYNKYIITNIIEHEEEEKLEQQKEHDKRPFDPENIEWDEINHEDAPDYTDAYIKYAEHADGTPYNDDEMEELNSSENRQWVYDTLMEHLY